MHISNCFNYVGSKDRVIDVIDKNLNKNKKFFIDVFCGSGVVGINETTNYSKILLNDRCWQLVETLKYFRSNKVNKTLKDIDYVINQFNLSKTNKEGFIKLREYYNDNFADKETFNPMLFYCLVTHAFNYNIHINKSGKFSVPSGANRCYFNSSLRNKLRDFQDTLNTFKGQVTFKCEDFEQLIMSSDKVIKDSMFYVDPPYLSSDDSYSRIHYLGKWNTAKEEKLYKCLDYINNKGGSFLLSNVLVNNGKINHTLIDWSQKYQVVDVQADYSNCNYQRKNLGDTREVLVRNYEV